MILIFILKPLQSPSADGPSEAPFGTSSEYKLDPGFWSRRSFRYNKNHRSNMVESIKDIVHIWFDLYEFEWPHLID